MLAKKFFEKCDDTDKNCSICLDKVNSFNESYITSCCAIIFHNICMSNYSNNQDFKCPLCRQLLPKIKSLFNIVVDDLNDIEYYVNEKGLDINIQNNYGDTILMYVLQNYTFNNYQMLFKILKMGININIQNNNGYTALHYALKLNTAQDKKYEYIINTILNMNPNLNLQNCDGETPLRYALRYCKKNTKQVICKILDMTQDINIKDKNGETPLRYALCYCKDIEEVIYKILDMNPDLNIKNNNGYTILMTAVVFKHSYKVLNKILDMKPDINIKNNDGKTALMFALQDCKFTNIINKILDMKPDLNTTDITIEENTALTIAKKYVKNAKILKRLELTPQ